MVGKVDHWVNVYRWSRRIIAVGLVSLTALFDIAPAKAVFIQVQSQALILGTPGTETCSELIFDGPSFSSCTSGPAVWQSSTSFAAASTNYVTGELKIEGTNVYIPSSAIRGTRSITQARIDEQLEVAFDPGITSGTITATMVIEGSSIGGAVSDFIQATVSLLGTQSTLFDIKDDPNNNLSLTLDYKDGDAPGNIVPFFTVLNSLFSGDVVYDLSNTASFRIDTSIGLNLVPSNPLFLSNPTLQSVVTPEPTTLSLLLIGTLGAALARRRRSVQRTQ